MRDTFHVKMPMKKMPENELADIYTVNGIAYTRADKSIPISKLKKVIKRYKGFNSLVIDPSLVIVIADLQNLIDKKRTK